MGRVCPSPAPMGDILASKATAINMYVQNPSGVWVPAKGDASGNTIIGTGTNNIGSVGFTSAGNSQTSSINAFWNAAVVGAGGTSSSVSVTGFGKIRIFVNTSVADTFNVQISLDAGVTWYTLTQDNAGTPVIIATTTTQLLSCRDIATFGGLIRLLSISAATITAGYAAEVV